MIDECVLTWVCLQCLFVAEQCLFVLSMLFVELAQVHPGGEMFVVELDGTGKGLKCYHLPKL